VLKGKEKKKKMYANRDAITVDMGVVNHRRDELPANTLRFEGPNCYPSPFMGMGDTKCKTEKQCKQINRELDAEERHIQRLRREYDMQDFTSRAYDTMYMLDPSRDDEPKSQHVDYHPLMYALDRGGPTGTGPMGCTNRAGGMPRVGDPALFRINPNIRDNFTPDEEQWTLEPGSKNIAARKCDLAERRKLRIYPHMYNYEDVIARDKDKSADQMDDALRATPSMSLGGVNYPIPMYFQLGSLQQPIHQGKGHNIDYDLHLRTKSKDLPTWHDVMIPKQLLLRDNVDFDLAEPVNEAIINESLQQDSNVLRPRIAYRDRLKAMHPPRVYGMRQGAEYQDMTCPQTRRQRSQEEGVRDQWYRLKALPVETCTCNRSALGGSRIVGDGCRACARKVTMGPSESRTFGGREPNLTPQPGDIYPNPRDQKTGFFELGPALPPPDPLLLSNVPSRLLMHRQAITSSSDREGALKLRLQSAGVPDTQRFKEGFNGAVGTGTAAEAITTAASGALSALPGQAQQVAAGSDGLPRDLGASIPASQRLNGVPSGIRTKLSGVDEFHRARSSLEREQKDVVDQTLQQQYQALIQISDLRHNIAGLKQLLTESRARSQIMDVHQADERIQQAVHAIGSLRDVIHAVQKRRARAMSRLKQQLTPKEYGYFETVVANRVKLMETQVRQYHKQPADDAIEAFREPHFRGDGYIMKKGFYPFPNVGGIGNNRLQSLKIGKGVQVRLYERANKKGKILTYIGPRRVGLLPTMWNNAVSAIEVLDKEGPHVTAFDAPFFQGGRVRLPLGFHDYPDVGGIQAGKLASIWIPDDLEVTFYSRPKGEGEKVKFIGPQKLSFLPADWNKKVFGITVSEKFPGEK
jgi:hypothetical protein